MLRGEHTLSRRTPAAPQVIYYVCMYHPYVCMHVFMYVCEFIHTSIRLYIKCGQQVIHYIMYVCMPACMYIVCMYIHTYIKCTCIYACMYMVCMYVRQTDARHTLSLSLSLTQGIHRLIKNKHKTLRVSSEREGSRFCIF